VISGLVSVVRMSVNGASRPLPHVPAKVSKQTGQRAFSRRGANRSSCLEVKEILS
jgi:hypothetical protein